MRYPVECHGDCLGDFVPNGARLVADTEAAIEPLTLVSIVIRDGEGPWARWIRSTGEVDRAACKVFLARLEGMDGHAILVGQINPPVVSLIPEAEIEALHAVVGVVGVSGGAELSEADREAFSLIAPFGKRDGMQPINPDWRPPSDAVRRFVEGLAA